MKSSPRQACATWGLFWLLAACVMLAGCSDGREAEAALGVSPLPTVVPQPSPNPAALPVTTAGPVLLVILHTNDNWGETEPCG